MSRRQRDDSLIKMDLGCLGVLLAMFAIGGIGVAVKFLALGVWHHPALWWAVVPLMLIPVLIAGIYVHDRWQDRRDRERYEASQREP
jgi:hypothetical protein